MTDRKIFTDTSPLSYGSENAYNSGNYTGYGLYGNSAVSYYQQMASGLRAAQSTSFPYGIGTPSAYYGTPYATGLDYTCAYNPSYYSGMRNASAYYGAALAAGPSAYAPTTSSDNPTTDLPFAIKAEKKSKSSKKKNAVVGGPAPVGDEHYARVFVYDLDDICSTSTKSLEQLKLQVSTYGMCNSGAVQLVQQLGATMATQCAMPLERIDEFEICNIEDATVEETVPEGAIVDDRGGVEVMRKIAGKYCNLKQLYNELALESESSPSFALLERCNFGCQKENFVDAVRYIDEMFRNRNVAGKRCMELVQQRSEQCTENYANVVVGNNGLVAAICQLLIAGYANYVPIENIYSMSKAGKEAVLERITARFGKKCSYVVVTSNVELTEQAKMESIPVWPAATTEDLSKLYSAQHLYLTNSPTV